MELLRTLESYAKNLPIVGRMLGAVMTPLTGFLEKVSVAASSGQLTYLQAMHRSCMSLLVTVANSFFLQQVEHVLDLQDTCHATVATVLLPCTNPCRGAASGRLSELSKMQRGS